MFRGQRVIIFKTLHVFLLNSGFVLRDWSKSTGGGGGGGLERKGGGSPCFQPFRWGGSCYFEPWLGGGL